MSLRGWREMIRLEKWASILMWFRNVIGVFIVFALVVLMGWRAWAQDGDIDFIPGRVFVRVSQEQARVLRERDRVERGGGGATVVQGDITALPELAALGAQLADITPLIDDDNPRIDSVSSNSNPLKTQVGTGDQQQIFYDDIDRWFTVTLADNSLQATVDAIEVLREAGFEYVEPAVRVEVAATPNDPYFQTKGSWGQPFDDLWGLKRVESEAAWDVTTGDSDFVIAVIDTGIDFNHRDLAGQLWSNADEVPGNGLDDDLNGYIDDVAGWNFFENSNSLFDDNAHGTHVAGTIAARGNNALDVTGVMWEAKIMPLKAFDHKGDGTAGGAAAAIRYAVDNGAKIINNSWGGTATQIVRDAVLYAAARDVLLTAASGNLGCDLDGPDCEFSPAIEPEVIAVGATDPGDLRAQFSNFGSAIELVAPGGGNAGFLGRGILSLRSAGTPAIGSRLNLNDHLMVTSGTSMATPVVSGVAGLVWSRYPELTASQVRQRLRDSAVDIGTSGRDDDFGFGLVQARAALTDGVEITGPAELVVDEGVELTADYIARSLEGAITSFTAQDLPAGASFR